MAYIRPAVNINVPRILASLSLCWFRCVFSQACWLLHRDITSDVKYIWGTFMLTAGWIYDRAIIYVNHASHLISKIQYVHTSNLGTDVRCFALGTKENTRDGIYSACCQHKCPSNIHVHDISISYLIVTTVWSHLFNGTPVLLISIFALKLKLMVACYNSIYQRLLYFFLCVYIDVIVMSTDHIIFI
jgi:hypothetical protein